MHVVLATQHLSSLGGTSTYLLTLAEQLQRLGHEVGIDAEDLGEMAEEARSRGVPVSALRAGAAEGVDAVVAQDAAVALALAERHPRARHAFVAHSDRIDLQVPPQLPGVTGVVVVMNERVRRRMEAFAVSVPVARLRQPIDVDRFAPRGPLRRRPERVVLLGNYLFGERRDALLAALARFGATVRVIGRHGEPSAAPERALADADVVIGKGRSILEGMACGRAALVCDDIGFDGWVTPESYDALEADGFGGQATPAGFEIERIVAALERYRPDMGQANRDLAIRHHSAARHAQDLVAVLRELAPSEPPPAAPLREMARLVQLAWRAESRAAAAELHESLAREERERARAERERARGEAAEARGEAERRATEVRELGAEVARLRAELLAAGDASSRERASAQALAARVTALEGELRRLKETRRYRFSAALARPVDRLRARARRTAP